MRNRPLLLNTPFSLPFCLFHQVVKRLEGCHSATELPGAHSGELLTALLCTDEMIQSRILPSLDTFKLLPYQPKNGTSRDIATFNAARRHFLLDLGDVILLTTKIQAHELLHTLER